MSNPPPDRINDKEATHVGITPWTAFGGARLPGEHGSIGRRSRKSDDAGGGSPPAYDAMARDLFAQLVGIDSTHGIGSAKAAEILAAKFKAAGFSGQ
jgi:hypothetical protein